MFYTHITLDSGENKTMTDFFSLNIFDITLVESTNIIYCVGTVLFVYLKRSIILLAFVSTLMCNPAKQ